MPTSNECCWTSTESLAGILCIVDQIRADYISSSHTRLIRRLTLKGWIHLVHAHVDKFGSTNQILEQHCTALCSFMSTPKRNHEQLYSPVKFSSLPLRRCPITKYLLCAYSCFMPHLSSKGEGISRAQHAVPLQACAGHEDIHKPISNIQYHNWS